MKKMLIYALALALALSLTACGQPNAEQPTDPAPSTSAPEPIATPEPIKDPVPHSRNYLRPKSIITVFPAIINGEINGLCA